MVQAVERASLAIGDLSQALQAEQAPQPTIPFLLREAVWSNRLEGNSATLQDVLVGRVGADREMLSAEHRQIINYQEVLVQARKMSGPEILELSVLEQWHAGLFAGLPDIPEAGSFRSQLHWIGPPGQGVDKAWYIPPPPELIKDGMQSYLAFVRSPKIPRLAQLALGQYQLEAIHPFMHGNGLWVRLVFSILAVQSNLVPLPVLGISEYLYTHRKAYLECLDKVGKNSEWDRWLLFFLEAVEVSARATAERWRAYRQGLADAAEQASRQSSRVPGMIMDLLANNPLLTAKQVSEELEVAFTTAQRAIDKLQDMGILEKMGGAHRYRSYGAPALLAALEE